jgi:nicotinamide-nucleotide amidase
VKSPRVELICVGSELLTGKTNAHAAYFSEKLEEAGLALARETTVGDDPAEMRAAFAEAWRRSDAVICTGGLGPTFDDITRESWSRVTGRALKLDRALEEAIRERFRHRGMRMPPANRRQAFLLAGARPLDNPHGTAPGQTLQAGRKLLALLPGPARELHPMAERHLFPLLRRLYGPGFRQTRVYRLFGVAESAVDEKLRALMEKSRGRVRVTWGILAQKSIVDIKVTAAGPEAPARDKLARLEAAIRRRFGKDIFGEGRDTLEEIVGRLMARRRLSLVAAESCTGGLIAQKVTRVPGSSAYFLQGLVTYSNAAKIRLLGVKPGSLKKHGAVSEACAREMAGGCRRRAGADLALAVTGIAGPAGGSDEKPVGLVYIALAGPRGIACEEHRFSGDREQIRERAALAALDLLRKTLLR